MDEVIGSRRRPGAVVLTNYSVTTGWKAAAEQRLGPRAVI
jgi:hypothetical protein